MRVAEHRVAADRSLWFATVRRRVEEGLESLRRRDAGAAVEAFASAWAIAERWELDPDVQSGILANLALAHALTGDYEAALTACLRALALHGLEPQQRAKLLNNAGMISGHGGQPRRAAAYFARAYRLARGHDAALGARAAANAALACREAGLASRAVRWARRALAAAEGADPTTRQFALLQLAASLLAGGALDEAARLLDALRRRGVAEEVAGDALRLEAELAWHKGDLRSARAAAARAADLAARDGSPEDLAAALRLLRQVEAAVPGLAAPAEIAESLRACEDWVAAFFTACTELGVGDAGGERVALALADAGGLVLVRAGRPEAMDRAAAMGLVVGSRWQPGHGPHAWVRLGAGSPADPFIVAWPRRPSLARALAVLATRHHRDRTAERVRAEQELTLAKLAAFHDVALAVGGPLETEELVAQLLSLTRQVVAAEAAGIVFTATGEVRVQGMREAALLSCPVVARVAESGRPARSSSADPGVREALAGLGVAALVAVPVYFGSSGCGAVLVAARYRPQPFRERDVELLAFVSRQFGLALENAALRDDLRRRLDALTQDLAVARRLQRTLMPERPLEGRGFAVAGLSLPAKHVGGDVFGYWRLDDGSWVAVVGDVMGKGVGAAMLGTILHHRVRELLREEGFGEGLVRRLASVMWDDLSRARALATVVLLRCEPRTRRMEAVTAGHHGPVRWRRGRWEPAFAGGGTALGLSPAGGQAVRAEWRTEDGELTLIYSDGFGELLMGQRGLFRAADVARALERLGTPAGEDGLEGLLEAIRGLASGHELTDDVTVVAAQVRGEEVAP